MQNSSEIIVEGQGHKWKLTLPLKVALYSSDLVSQNALCEISKY